MQSVVGPPRSTLRISIKIIHHASECILNGHIYDDSHAHPGDMNASNVVNGLS